MGHVVPDSKYAGMWRVQWSDGRRSDLTNLTRAKDALARFAESEERRERGRKSHVEALPVRRKQVPATTLPEREAA